MIGGILRYLVRVPVTIPDHNRRCRAMAEVYDRHLLPAIAADVPAGSPLDQALRSSVRAYALRTLFYVQNFTRMAGRAADPEAGLACGMFATLYDTSIDTGILAPERLPTFIEDLTAGAYAEHPVLQMRLMHRLYNGHIRRRLPETTYPVLYESFRRIHDLQIRSLAQAGKNLTPGELVALTDEKGGVATLLFSAAGKPTFTPEEVDVIMHFGAVLQHVDDLEDRALDRRTGVRTPSTEGLSGPWRLWKAVDAAAKHVRRVYARDRGATREFTSGMWMWYLMACTYQFSPLFVELTAL